MCWTGDDVLERRAADLVAGGLSIGANQRQRIVHVVL